MLSGEHDSQRAWLDGICHISIGSVQQTWNPGILLCMWLDECHMIHIEHIMYNLRDLAYRYPQY